MLLEFSGPACKINFLAVKLYTPWDHILFPNKVTLNSQKNRKNVSMKRIVDLMANLQLCLQNSIVFLRSVV